jgi:ectoine hydroxylase-related dioxygenase (phytanoyl-CoA dioxygenase family)
MTAADRPAPPRDAAFPEPGPLVESSELLADPSALRARFAADGYVFLKGIVDREALLALRRQVLTICGEHGWTRPGADPMQGAAEGPACLEGEEAYYRVYDDVQRLEALHALPHHRSVREPMIALLGETAFPHPLAIARLMFPDNAESATPAHQDHRNNQGTEDLLACWIPLSDCPTNLGALSVLRGSHRVGLLPIDFAVGPGYREVQLADEAADLDWVAGDFDLGDMIVFHSLTVHRALPNRTDRLRLSVDYRFQREGEPLTEICLKPHYARLSWEEIYADWTRSELQHYWRAKRYQTVEFDPSLLELSPEQLTRAVDRWSAWRDRHPQREPT